MGYEQKFIIGEKTKAFFEPICVYDYCTDDLLAEFINIFGDDINYEIYFPNSDEKLSEDKYGQPIKQIDLDALIAYLENNKLDYRRYTPFLNLLKGFKAEEANYNKLVVLRFSY